MGEDSHQGRRKKLSLGQRFLQTSMDLDEKLNDWLTYNLIRDVESTFKTLKTDLDLRPIFHKNDERTKAHLNLGILTFGLVNTIRCKSKQENITWCELRF